ncbi:MAG: hypothetical protein HY921_05590 [Elusimicrobia bacterium]|nr:hypothetical protein [Elusimicrobiota bacterium]
MRWKTAIIAASCLLGANLPHAMQTASGIAEARSSPSPRFVNDVVKANAWLRLAGKPPLSIPKLMAQSQPDAALRAALLGAAAEVSGRASANPGQGPWDAGALALFSPEQINALAAEAKALILSAPADDVSKHHEQTAQAMAGKFDGAVSRHALNGPGTASSPREAIPASAIEFAAKIETARQKMLRNWEGNPESAQGRYITPDIPHPRSKLLEENVDFIQAGGTMPRTIRTRNNAYLHFETGTPGVILAWTTDGQRRDYVLRAMGDSYYEVFLPPDIEIFAFAAYISGSRAFGWGEIEDGQKHVQIIRAADDPSAWRKWLEEKLRPESVAVKRRNFLYGAMHGLFHIRRKAKASKDPEALKEMPPVPPGSAQAKDVIKILARFWEEQGLEEVHGSFDYWLVMAALSDFQSPAVLWKNVHLLIALDRPRAFLYMAKTLAMHLRAFPGHPLEYFGDPGRPQVGLVDLANLAEILPRLVSTCLEKFPRPHTPGEHDPSRVGERVLYLWVIATSLDPAIYLERMAWVRFGIELPYRQNIIEGLKALGRPRETEALLREIYETRWEDYGLENPWSALSLADASDNSAGRSKFYALFQDSRPIKFLVLPPSSSEKEKPSWLGDPGLSNMKRRKKALTHITSDDPDGFNLPDTVDERHANFLQALAQTADSL